MAVPGPTSRCQARPPLAPPAARDHGFHSIRVERVVDETADACSLVLEVPQELQAAFAYDAGQFCTFRVSVEGEPYLRCYSMSSAPAVDDQFQVTVKRVPGGAVSNWLLDHVEAGDTLEVTCPAGVFRLAPDETELVAFAAGSGITPVFSLIKTALATTDRRVRLVYANRDADSVIFGAAIDRLAAHHPDRLHVVHHLDVEHGYLDADAVTALLGDGPAGATRVGAGFYLCGPPPFMDVVEDGLLAAGVDPSRIHVERFTPVANDTAATDTAVESPDTADVAVTA